MKAAVTFIVNTNRYMSFIFTSLFYSIFYDRSTHLQACRTISPLVVLGGAQDLLMEIEVDKKSSGLLGPTYPSP